MKTVWNSVFSLKRYSETTFDRSERLGITSKDCWERSSTRTRHATCCAFHLEKWRGRHTLSKKEVSALVHTILRCAKKRYRR